LVKQQKSAGIIAEANACQWQKLPNSTWQSGPERLGSNHHNSTG